MEMEEESASRAQESKMEMTRTKEEVNAPNEKGQKKSIETLSHILAFTVIALPFVWHHPKLLSQPWFKQTVDGWNGIYPWHIILFVLIITSLVTSIWSIVKNIKNRGRWGIYLHSALDIIVDLLVLLISLSFCLIKNLEERFIRGYNEGTNGSKSNFFWEDYSPIVFCVVLLWCLGTIAKNQYDYISKNSKNKGIIKARLWLLSLMVLFIIVWAISSSFTLAILTCIIYALLTWVWNKYIGNNDGTSEHETNDGASKQENKGN